MHMDIGEYMKEFEAKFSKLKSNRQKIPLEQLTTRYAKSYTALVKWLENYAEWFTEMYTTSLALPEKPGDEAGNAWLRKKIEAIKAEERKPGGLYQQSRDALIDDLDLEKFNDRVWRIHDRLMREAYDPYQQRFNRWVGKPGKRRIYNSLFDSFWIADTRLVDGGFWIDSNGKYRRMGYPPRIGPDKEGG